MKKYLTIIFLILFYQNGIGQSNSPSEPIDFKKIIPPNPNVAALFKSTITPIRDYAGLPEVSIPLYNVDQGNIVVPINISNNTSGIQVGEESGQVGLGWSLNAGGAITRTINGIDDFAEAGYYNHNGKHPDLPTMTDDGLQFGHWRPDLMAFVNSENTNNSDWQEEDCYYLVDGEPTHFSLITKNPLLDETDYMPDEFYFNFGGYSGSFVFDINRNPKLLRKSGLKVELMGVNGAGFKITTPDGTKYEFLDASKTYILTSQPKTYTTTWFLSSITDVLNNKIEFLYEVNDIVKSIPSFTQSFITQYQEQGEKLKYWLDTSGPIIASDDIFLNSIETFASNGQPVQEVVFNYSSSELYPDVRKDMHSKYLANINVINQNDKVVQTFDFAYSYFGTEDIPYNSLSFANGDYSAKVGVTENSTENPHLNLRLRLDSVTKNQIDKHSFQYYDSCKIPNKTNMGQDYWGYYNGAINANTFIPYAYDYQSNALLSEFTPERKANRIPNATTAKVFSLKSITYPTKGKTEFDYELNTYDPDSNPGEFPIATVMQSERASLVAEPENDDILDAQVITPKQGSVLKLTFNVTFTGWSTAFNNGQYENVKPDAPEWDKDFYVDFLDKNGNLMRSRFHIPIDNPEWFNITPEINKNGYTNPEDAESKVINYSFTEEWYFDENEENQLIDEEYTIVARFNSHNGLFYGQADIHAEWDEALLSATQQYSVGGGLRIKTISDLNYDNTLARKQEFNYHYQEEQSDGSFVEKSYGKIKTMPTFNISKAAVLNISPFASQFLYGFHPTIVASATSQNTFSKDLGSYVGYDQVESYNVGPAGKNGKKVKEFHNNVDMFRPVTPSFPTVGEQKDSYHQFPPIRLPQNGLLKRESDYSLVDNTFKLVQESELSYKINGIDLNSTNAYTLEDLYQNNDKVISAIKQLPIYMFSIGTGPIKYEEWFVYCDYMYLYMYPHYSNLVQHTKSVNKTFDQNTENAVTTTQEFFYENDIHYLQTRETITQSNGSVLETKTYYPDDIEDANTLLNEGGILENYGVIAKLKYNGEQHQIGTPVQTTTKIKDGEILGIQRTEFAEFDGIVLPAKGQFAKKDLLEDRLLYENYLNGKPRQLRKESGIPVSYIWGYNETYPIAKIENSTFENSLSAARGALPSGYSDLEPFINSLSGIETDPAKKQAWKNFNDDFRSALSNQMISTYTYDPLVGVTSVTDPRGYTIYYIYDAQNRLKEVRDAAGDLVTDYEYHYKGQTNN